MRILAIRGQNLASLANFDVSLESGPLHQAGLFAITGPTGAGKSALLDAMCLALYDHLPRIKGKRGSYRVADSTEQDALTVTDPRHIVQRGAAEAFAEVDFIGCDNRRWRARWSVKRWSVGRARGNKRARGKMTGKLQAAQVELFALPSQTPMTEHCKEATLKLIAERVGLTYEQFCRSVLLAQGDFAAFLNAKADERAQILEALTDTQLYAAISKAAHERVREEKATLAALEAEASGFRPLSEAERAELEHSRHRLERQRQAWDAERQARERDRQWHARRAALAAGVAELERNYEAARQARHKANADADRLARLERAEGLRHAYDQARLARQEREEAVRRQTDLVARLEDVKETLAAAQSQACQAEERLRAVEAERAAKQPEIDRAGKLDVQIAETDRRRSEAERRSDEATRQERAAREALAQAEREQAEIDEALRQDDRWLAENERLKTLVTQWALCEQAIQAYTEAKREIGRLSDEEAKLGAALEAQTNNLEQARQAADTANAQLETAKAKLASAAQALTALQATQSPAAQQEARRQLAERQRQLEDLRRLREEAIRVEHDRAAAETSGRAAQDALAELERRLAELVGARVSLEAEQRAREQELRLAQAMEELAARRPELLFPGRPCPLCGSTEHPDADKPAPPSEAVACLSAELDAARQRLAEQNEAMQQIQRQCAAEEANAQAARARLDEAVARQRSYWSQWEASRPADFPNSPLAPDAEAALDNAFAQLTAKKDALDQAGQAYEAAREARDQAQSEVNHFGEQARQAQATLQRLEAKRQALENERSLCQAQREPQVARCDRARQALAPIFAWQPDWQATLDADAGNFLAQARRLLADWQAAEQRKQDALKRKAELERAIAARQAALEAAQARLEAAQRELSTVAAELEQRRQARAALLDGKLTEAVRKALNDARQKAGEDLHNARQRLNVVERDKTAVEAALTAATDLCEKRASEAEQARKALEAALAAAGFGEDDLAELLAVPGAERERLRSRLQELDNAMVAAEGAFESKRQELEAHLASNPPNLPQADIEAKLAELDARIANGDRELGALNERLRQDEDLRRRSAELAERIEAQRARYTVWASLDNVIGSADGKKLRLFVQGLYFRTLLEQANHYLQQLRQRYRLAPVNGAELEIQIIDRVMGDAIRPVTTLSGGETFLVSLALALGLSAMSANKVTVESLFIDEGFGTLDPQSLEEALGMLDQLQATGRQIGIISHIPELAERIGYRIAVTPNGRGVSQVSIIGG